MEDPDEGLLAPVVSQEIWAAGVTYRRSREARSEESGDRDVYDRVYGAVRPELFYKGNRLRVVGHREPIRVRADSAWNVPEPELTLVLNPAGNLVGYTIGNDVSSRDIEGDNPLYLPQAKVYDGGCALGPGILVTRTPLTEAAIVLRIERGGKVVFEGQTDFSLMKRSADELAEYLFRECRFPSGVFLMTGTGVVPDGNFTLMPADRVLIAIEPIGVLENVVADPRRPGTKGGTDESDG